MPSASRKFRLDVTLAPAFLVLALAAAGSTTTEAQSSQVSPQMQAEAMKLMQLCRADYDRLCSGVQPGGGRVLLCLQAHMKQLSPSCAGIMSQAETLKSDAAASGVLPK